MYMKLLKMRRQISRNTVWTSFSTAPENVRNLGFGAGMGLPNMKKYTDELAIETEKDVGTTVTMKVNL